MYGSMSAFTPFRHSRPYRRGLEADSLTRSGAAKSSPAERDPSRPLDRSVEHTEPCYWTGAQHSRFSTVDPPCREDAIENRFWESGWRSRYPEANPASAVPLHVPNWEAVNLCGRARSKARSALSGLRLKAAHNCFVFFRRCVAHRRVTRRRIVVKRDGFGKLTYR